MGENIFRLLDEMTAITRRARKVIEDMTGTVVAGVLETSSAQQASAQQALGANGGADVKSVRTSIPAVDLEAFNRRMAERAAKVPVPVPAPVKKAKGPVSDARRMQGQWMSAVRVLSPADRELAKAKRGELGLRSAIEWAKSQAHAG